MVLFAVECPAASVGRSNLLREHVCCLHVQRRLVVPFVLADILDVRPPPFAPISSNIAVHMHDLSLRLLALFASSLGCVPRRAQRWFGLHATGPFEPGAGDAGCLFPRVPVRSGGFSHLHPPLLGGQRNRTASVGRNQGSSARHGAGAAGAQIRLHARIPPLGRIGPQLVLFGNWHQPRASPWKSILDVSQWGFDPDPGAHPAGLWSR
mmetsp:Transcript_57325/g.134385  ORF Transcript_57325/g.134385 Transcript_57325/m.134385 type:complete len:208 (-) Transcript_57325:1004-1627(-)